MDCETRVSCGGIGLAGFALRLVDRQTRSTLVDGQACNRRLRLFLHSNGSIGCSHLGIFISVFLIKINSVKRNLMPQVPLNAPAPDFTLADFKGQPVRLADFRGKAHVLLVFNRGFI